MRITIDTLSHLLKPSHFQRFVVWEYIEIVFLIHFQNFSLIDYSCFFLVLYLLFNRNQVVYLKRPNFLKLWLIRIYCFLWNFLNFLAITTKSEENFWKFGYRFWYQLKKVFLINYQYFRNYTTFLLKFCYSIKRIWSMSFDMFLWLHKHLLSKSEGILRFRGLAMSFQGFRILQGLWQ